jgi:tetraacyldisaccharide 4'-kinase
MSARRPWLYPLVPAYATAIAAKNMLRRAGLARGQRLAWPVLSVGSLSAGGAGKTPVVIALASLLRARGWHVDILSRGYGRTSRGVARVEAAADNAADIYGDEPVLLAERTGAPVWVSTSRYDAGHAAEAAETLEPGEERALHLLDDGFQHRRLARAIDIALVTAADLDDALLPAGNRREFLSALGRADFVLLREDEQPRIEQRVRTLLKPGVLVWTLRRSLHFAAPLFVFGAGLRPIAFCAIARPEGFEAMLKDAGCGIADTIFFPDHHRYTMADVDRIVELARSLHATGLVTTEKDAVKLSPAMRDRLGRVGALIVAELRVEFVYPERLMRELEARLATPKPVEAAR